MLGYDPRKGNVASPRGVWEKDESVRDAAHAVHAC